MGFSVEAQGTLSRLEANDEISNHFWQMRLGRGAERGSMATCLSSNRNLSASRLE